MTRRDFGYTGWLGPEQLEWLRGDLAAARAAGKPIVVFSHIPVLSVCVFFDDGQEPPWNTKKSARETFADWLTGPKNRYFARNMVNRTWAQPAVSGSPGEGARACRLAEGGQGSGSSPCSGKTAARVLSTCRSSHVPGS